jgi:hypothetical protein
MESMNLSPHGKPHMGAIPSLDRLLADPAAFNLLPADTQNAVHAQVAALEAAFCAKILTRGAGSLFKQAGSPNWFSSFSRHGVEHVESCGTPDLKAAKKIHKTRLDKLASERQGHETFLTPSDKKVTDGELLDAWRPITGSGR